MRTKLAGYVAGLLPLAAILVVFRGGSLHGAGWRGGQYAQAFVVVTFVALVAGAAVRARDPRWRPFGTGLILAGVTGLLLIAVAVGLLVYALSHARFVF